MNSSRKHQYRVLPRQGRWLTSKALACQLAQVGCTEFGEAWHGVQSSSDGGTTHVDFVQQFDVALQIQNLLFQVVGVSVELLSERHWHGILQLGATHLDGILIFVGFVAQGADQSCEAGNERLVHTDDGETDGCGVHVVGRLSAVHVVIGVAILVFALLVAHEFERTVGDDLVGVHVHRCAGTALHHVDGEVFVQLAVDDFLTCFGDGTCNLVVDDTQRVVGLHGSQFHVGDGDDVVGESRASFAGNMIIVDTALRLYAVIGLCRNFEFTEKVGSALNFFSSMIIVL